MLSPPVSPPSAPLTRVVHIGFEPCRRSGYEGRTCITVDRGFRFAWLAMTCLDSNDQVIYDDCVYLSDPMKQFAVQEVMRIGSQYVWKIQANGYYVNHTS